MLLSVPLKSSAIRSAAFVPDDAGLPELAGAAGLLVLAASALAGRLTGTLILEMTDGSELRYPDVSLATFHQLVTSRSPGSYYNQAIRGR